MRKKHILMNVLSCMLSVLLIWQSSNPHTLAFAIDEQSPILEEAAESVQDVSEVQDNDDTINDELEEISLNEQNNDANGNDEASQSNTDSLPEESSPIEIEEIPSDTNTSDVNTTSENKEPITENSIETKDADTKLSAKGDDFELTVSFNQDANLPDTTTMNVLEITEDSPLFADTIRNIRDFLNPEKIYDIRVFDITLEQDGTSVEPNAPVTVNAQINTMTADKTQITHLAENGPETIVPTVSDNACEFVTDSFSRYVFYEQIGEKGTPATDLDGLACPLLVERAAGKRQYGTIQAEPTTFYNVNGLAAKQITNAGTYYQDRRLRYVSDDTETIWHFEAVDPDDKPGTYYVWADVNGQHKYMTIEPRQEGDLTLSDTAGPDQEIDVLYDDNGLVRLDHGGFAPNLSHDNFSKGFQSHNYLGASEKIILGQPLGQQASAYIANVTDLRAEKRVYGQDGSIGEPEEFILYGEYTTTEGHRAYVTLNHNGTLIPATVSGDKVWWYEDVTYSDNNTPTWNSQNIWKLVEYVDEIDDESGTPTGYWEICATDNSSYVAPSHAGTVSDSTIGLSLDGRKNGDAYTHITAWDNTAGRYFELNIDTDTMMTTATVAPVSGIEWSVATIEPPQGELDPISPTLHEVATVAPPHATMTFFDFDESTQNSIIGTTAYTATRAQTGLLSPSLDEGGWPTTTRTNKSLSELYTADAQVSDNADLFLKNVFDSTGVYRYDSRENYAWLNENGEWEVYRELGTGTSNDLNYGNFLPLNSIRQASNRINRNTDLGEEDPRYSEPIYISSQQINYQFGMRMDVDFYFTPNGITERGDPIIYEFSGDDDLWVYVDNRLVLDLGGIHNRLSGSIDFSTGIVQCTAQEDTTLFDIFHNAGIFPNGDAWNNTRVSEHFAMTYDELTGEFIGTPTFADYTGHTFSLFYMERGGHGSDLKMEFNLPTAQDETFTITKTLGDAVDERYANATFAFQAIIAGTDSSPSHTLHEATFVDTEEPVEFNQVTIDGVTYDDVFFLRPGQSAVFQDISYNEYYVKELGVKAEDFDRVLINNNDWDHNGGTVPENGIITSTPERISYRPHTVFENIPSQNTIRNIEIEKQIDENSIYDPKDTFEFYVFVEETTSNSNTNTQTSQLVPYSTAPYMLLSPNGKYCQGLVDGIPQEVSDDPVIYENSGPYGTIAGVPAGYTIIIPNIMSGTEFLVEERTSRLNGYELVSTELIADETYQSDTATLTNQTVSIDGTSVTRDALGTVASGYDSKVLITNKATNQIEATKQWVDTLNVTDHAPVTFALFLADDPTTIVAGTEHTVESPDWSTTWTVANPDKYVVRELIHIEGTPTPTTGGQTVPCTVTIDTNQQMILEYTATYETPDNNTTIITNTYDENQNAIPLPNTGSDGRKTLPIVCGIFIFIIAICEMTRRQIHESFDSS